MGLKKVLLIVAGLLCSVLISTTAHAQLSYKKHSFFNNSKGLNDSLSSTNIADNEATAIQNIVFDTSGAISKRYGYQNIQPTTSSIYQVGGGNNAVTGLASYINPSTGNHYLVAIANVSGQATAYQKQLDASNTVPSGPWTNIGGSGVLPSNYTNDEQPVFTNASGVLVMSFPAFTGWPIVGWQATANVYQFPASAPNSACNAYFNNILFSSCDPANPTTVRFSDLTNGITIFNATDFFTLNFKDGHYVTAIYPAFGNLYIFEDNSIWMLTGSSRDTFSLQQMVSNIGTLSPHSVRLINNDLYFVTSQNDIAIYDGVFTVKYLSSKIRNTIGSNNFNRAKEALGIGFSSYKYKDLDYYVSESTNGNNTNNQILFFDTDREAWTIFNNFSPDSWTTLISPTGQNVLVWGDYSGNVFYYPNIGNYNDVSNSCSGGTCTVTSPSIYSFYTTKWFIFPEDSLGDKYFRVLKTYIQNSSLASTLTTTVNFDYVSPGKVFNYNFNPSGSIWDTAIWDVSSWGASMSLNVDREEPNVGKNMFQLQYSNNTVSQDMTVLGWEIYTEPTTQL